MRAGDSLETPTNWPPREVTPIPEAPPSDAFATCFRPEALPQAAPLPEKEITVLRGEESLIDEFRKRLG